MTASFGFHFLHNLLFCGLLIWPEFVYAHYHDRSIQSIIYLSIIYLSIYLSSIYLSSIYHCYIHLSINLIINRQGQYWQIAHPSFLVAWNGKKLEISNTVFYVYWRKLIRNRGKFSGTSLVLDTFLGKILLSTSTVLESLPQFRDNFLK